MERFIHTARPYLFIGIVAIQIAVLGAMVFRRERLLASPRSVLLQCEPVDPRSLLSGDYVILRYTISTFEPREMRLLNINGESYAFGETVYVALAPGNAPPGAAAAPVPHRAVAISRDLAALRKSYDLILRGRTTGSYEFPARADDADLDWRHTLNLKYGVEEYFVPQFEGLTIERELAKTTVEVALADSGEGAIRRLFLDGREVRFY